MLGSSSYALDIVLCWSTLGWTRVESEGVGAIYGDDLSLGVAHLEQARSFVPQWSFSCCCSVLQCNTVHYILPQPKGASLDAPYCTVLHCTVTVLHCALLFSTVSLYSLTGATSSPCTSSKRTTRTSSSACSPPSSASPPGMPAQVHPRCTIQGNAISGTPPQAFLFFDPGYTSGGVPRQVHVRRCTPGTPFPVHHCPMEHAHGRLPWPRPQEGVSTVSAPGRCLNGLCWPRLGVRRPIPAGSWPPHPPTTQ